MLPELSIIKKDGLNFSNITDSKKIAYIPTKENNKNKIKLFPYQHWYIITNPLYGAIIDNMNIKTIAILIHSIDFVLAKCSIA